MDIVNNPVSKTLGYIVGGSIAFVGSAVGLVILGVVTAVESVAWGVRAYQRDHCDGTAAGLEKRRILVMKCNEWEEKVTKIDRQYAKTMGLCLIPIAGFYKAWNDNMLGAASGHSIADSAEASFARERIGAKVKSAIYPLAGQRAEISDKLKVERCGWIRQDPFSTPDENRVHIETFRLPAGLNGMRTLDAVYVQGMDSHGKPVAEDAPTVILHHGNAMTLDGFKEHVQFYQKRGMNVLVVTMGDYPGSDPVPGGISERSTYEDAQAAVDYVTKVKKVPVNRCLVHGLSIGGTLAAYSGRYNPGVKVISDQSLTNVAAVAANVGGVVSAPLAGTLTQRLQRHAIPENAEEGLDGLNSKAKISEMQGDFLAISSSEDALMKGLPEILVDSYLQGRKNVEADNKDGKEKAASELAHGPRLTRDEMLVSIPGGHGVSFHESEAAAKKVERFLILTGMMSPENAIDIEDEELDAVKKRLASNN